MSKQFADISTRREYILGLTEVICQIFEISDPDRREAIILELEWLDDEALIEKQGYLENYFDSIIGYSNTAMSKIVQHDNIIKENQEKSNLEINYIL